MECNACVPVVESTYLYSPYLKCHWQPQSEVGKSVWSVTPTRRPWGTWPWDMTKLGGDLTANSGVTFGFMTMVRIL